MNWKGYGTDRDEEAQLTSSTVDQITVETNALAAKRKRERVAFGFTALITTAVVAGVALHSSSGGNGIAQTTLSQTAARASSFRGANFGIDEGASIKCSEDDPNLYRMTNDERRLYPSTDIAVAWDQDWEDYVVADCTNIPIGDDMEMPSDDDATASAEDKFIPADTAPAENEFSPTDPTDTPTDDPIAEQTENETYDSDVMEPEASEPGTESEIPSEIEPEVSQPSAESETSGEVEPEASEPGTESDTSGEVEPEVSQPGAESETSGEVEPEASEPGTKSEIPSEIEPEVSQPGAESETSGEIEPKASKSSSPGASGPETSGAIEPEASNPNDRGEFDHGMPNPGNPDKTEPGMPGMPESGHPDRPEPELMPEMPAPMMPASSNPDHAQPDSSNEFKPERSEPRQPQGGERGAEVDNPNSWWRKAPSESNPEPWVDAPEPEVDTPNSWWWKAPAAPESRPASLDDDGWNPNYGPQENHFRGSD